MIEKTHGMSRTPFYKVWSSMVQRCTNPNWKQWSSYGGRGISVSNEWRRFEAFRDDMLATYAPGLQLERSDNEGDYCKENCAWVTSAVQNRNKRTNVFVVYDGVRMVITDAAVQAGIHVDTIIHRNKAGLTQQTGLFAPPHRGVAFVQKRGASGFPGVTSHGNRFAAARYKNKIRIYLGTFATPQEAYAAWLAAAPENRPTLCA